MLYFVSILVLQDRESWLLYFSCRGCYRSLPLSQGAVGWSAVCDSGISWCWNQILIINFTNFLMGKRSYVVNAVHRLNCSTLISSLTRINKQVLILL